MAWSHTTEISTSNRVVIRITGAVDSTDTSYDIPWSALSPLLSDADIVGRKATRDDVSIDNIEGSCAGWTYAAGKGTVADNNLSFYWLTTTSGGADEEVFVGNVKTKATGGGKRSGLANMAKNYRTNLRRSGPFRSTLDSRRRSPAFFGKQKSSIGSKAKPTTSTLGNTNDDVFRVKLSSTPQASSFKGASFLVTFRPNQ